MSFSSTIKKDEDILHVSLIGNLINKQQAESLFDELEFQYGQGYSKIVIDLSEMQFMNSTGLNVLINILTQTRNKGGEAIISNVPDKVKDLLVITKLDSVFDIEDSLEEAKKRFK